MFNRTELNSVLYADNIPLRILEIAYKVDLGYLITMYEAKLLKDYILYLRREDRLRSPVHINRKLNFD
ncbi:hypothetical protein D3C87_853010 [compost metagenome]